MKSLASFAKFYEFTRISGMGMEVIRKVEPITKEIFEGDGDPEVKALNIAKRIFEDPKSTLQEKMFISWAIGFISGVNTTTSALDKMAESMMSKPITGHVASSSPEELISQIKKKIEEDPDLADKEISITLVSSQDMPECATRGSCEECTDECPYEPQEEFDLEEKASNVKKDRTIN